MRIEKGERNAIEETKWVLMVSESSISSIEIDDSSTLESSIVISEETLTAALRRASIEEEKAQVLHQEIDPEEIGIKIQEGEED